MPLLPRYSRNLEPAAYLGADAWSPPVRVREGLAVYDRGRGKPILLFPYPHAATASPMIDSALGFLLLSAGYRVLSFDPPGAYRSTRRSRCDLSEMLGCAEEALEVAGIAGPVAAAGHSMGAFCALAYAIERPGRVERLVLEGALSGFPAARRHGLPGKWLRPGDRDYGLFTGGGLRIACGLADMALMKRFLDLYDRLLVMDPERRSSFPLRPEAAPWAVPVRARWTLNLFRGLDRSRRLGEVRAPTLVMVGGEDRQTPPACAEELVAGIAGASLRAFPGVGHAPHLEAPGDYLEAVTRFLGS